MNVTSSINLRTKKEQMGFHQRPATPDRNNPDIQTRRRLLSLGQIKGRFCQDMPGEAGDDQSLDQRPAGLRARGADRMQQAARQPGHTDRRDRRDEP